MGVWGGVLAGGENQELKFFFYYPHRIICILLASGATGHMNYDKSEGRPQPGVCDPGTVVA